MTEQERPDFFRRKGGSDKLIVRPRSYEGLKRYELIFHKSFNSKKERKEFCERHNLIMGDEC